MKLSALILSTAMGLAATACFADPPVAGAAPATGGMCQTNPQECSQLAQQFDQWCTANADKCTALKAHVEKHREWCEQHKDKCQAMREKMHARMQQRCKANPKTPRCQTSPSQPGDEDDNGGNDDDTGA